MASGDRTRHPEFELARWAAANITLRNELQPPSSPQVSTAQCAPPQTAGWGGPRRICEFFRTTGNLARRARSSHPSRAQLSNPGDRPRSFGGGTCSGPRRAGARLAPPLLQLNPPIRLPATVPIFGEAQKSLNHQLSAINSPMSVIGVKSTDFTDSHRESKRRLHHCLTVHFHQLSTINHQPISPQLSTHLGAEASAEGTARRSSQSIGGINPS